MRLNVSWALLMLTLVLGDDPRKRLIIDTTDEEDISCTVHTCFKRMINKEDTGPFWANRGKKDPTYYEDRFYVDDPGWVLIKKNPENEPFYTSRGKKEFNLKGLKYWYNNIMRNRHRRIILPYEYEDPAFFAARGKKAE